MFFTCFIFSCAKNSQKITDAAHPGAAPSGTAREDGFDYALAHPSEPLSHEVKSKIERLSFARANALLNQEPSSLLKKALQDRLAVINRHSALHKKQHRLNYSKDSHVAVLLPMTGPMSRYAREIKTALTVSFDSHHVPYKVYDTKQLENEDLDLIAHAKEEGAFFAMGGLGIKEAKGLRRDALRVGLPFGVLAPMNSSIKRYANISYLWPSPEWEAEQTAYAAKELGFQRVGFLAARDSLGLRQRKAFVEAFSSDEESVSNAGHYDPESRTLESDLRRFFKLVPSMNPSFRRHVARYGKSGWKTFTPDLAMDMVYIADGVVRGALVASFFPYLNIVPRESPLMNQVGLRARYGGKIPTLVQIMGSFGWNQKDLSVRGGDASEGALVLAMCPPHDESLPESFLGSFVRPFEKRTGRKPTRTASIAYDIAEFVSQSVNEFLQQAIKPPNFTLKGELWEGVCGPASLNDNGLLERQVSLFRASGGGFDLEPW